jgi:DNA polymerase-3 subunit delta'
LLNLANGAPLAALQLVDQDILATRKILFQTLYSLSQKQTDPLKAAAALSDIELLSLLDFSLSWIVDLLRLQMSNDVVLNKDHLQQLTELKQQIILPRLIKFMEYLQTLRAQIFSGINLNKQLVVETLFIRWMEAV